ncbi:tyrosine-type recombinase/integrase [Actinoplanes philippinensis]|uniref:tyrosine-type recombinase/integrase n=1 Tax=Actinoplanes philippinensis TaxID=35752 RepID=UPI001EF327FD|nr:tyrosine-type recombinase/integrase [Actinoplanes philippinensis]
MRRGFGGRDGPRTRKLAALKSGLEFGPPKSAAGIRVVALPAVARKALSGHLAEFTAAPPEALVFTGDKDMPLRTGKFRRAVKWSKVLADAGMPAGFHFHDLRHAGNNIAAASGASTRELMHRMGHASMRAALITSTRRANGTARSPRAWTSGSPRARSQGSRPRIRQGSRRRPWAASERSAASRQTPHLAPARRPSATEDRGPTPNGTLMARKIIRAGE